ncbi:MAG: LicD family protein [Ruminococcaceae bacterium]|nr:LicD family protein [Oscillospiraceae bacterium]
MKKKKYHIEKDFIIKEELPITAIQDIEIDILRTFVDFCDKHNLRYFLAGGTLIGAVRHQGFIPWDDDMDVSMPRKDFERFRELTKDGKLGNYDIRSYIHTPELHTRPFDRLVDTRYMAKVNVKAEQPFIPPWLDIHALDGLPADPVENSKYWDAVNILKRGSKISRTPLHPFKKGGIMRVLRAIKNYKIHMNGYIYYARKLNEFGATYNFDTSEYIASVMAGYGRKERMPSYYFTDGEKKLYFEGILCSVPPHYNLVLKHMYNNFLQLPPVSERATHIERLWEVVPKEDR